MIEVVVFWANSDFWEDALVTGPMSHTLVYALSCTFDALCSVFKTPSSAASLGLWQPLQPRRSSISLDGARFILWSIPLPSALVLAEQMKEMYLTIFDA